MTSTTTTTLGQAFPAGYRAVARLQQAVNEGPLDHGLLELIKVRASQLNGCAFCLDMHWKDATAAGESADRLYLLDAWRESGGYTDAERAALAVTEAVTRIADEHVPAEVERAAREHFDDEAYAALVFAVIVINAWNRIAISGHSEPGHYQPGDDKIV